MNNFEIIKTVRLTEKGTRQGEKFNQYTVVADLRANKTQIRQAVQDLFKVKVLKVSAFWMTLYNYAWFVGFGLSFAVYALLSGSRSVTSTSGETGGALR